MRKFLTIAICVGMMATMLVGVAGAGLNSAASAHLYWLSAASSSGTVLASRTSVAPTAVGLVTLTGLASCRGIDLQIVIAATDAHTGYPLCWQNGAYTPKGDGWRQTTATILPPMYATTLDGGKATPVNAMSGNIIYQDPVNPQWTPNGCALIWFAQSAGVGKARSISREYGAFGFSIMPSTADEDLPCQPVCLNPNWRNGTGGHDNFNVLQLADAANALDFVAFAAGHKNLVYGDSQMNGCPEVTTPASSNTWGQVKRMYR
jgi:hypothetical protein